MFDFFKKKKTPELIIGSPVKGKTVPLSSVNDPTSVRGCWERVRQSFRPTEKFMRLQTEQLKHCLIPFMHSVFLRLMVWRFWSMWVWIQSKWGGDGFTGHVHSGDAVKKGDLILEIDLEKVKAAGYDTSTLVVICNTDDYGDVRGLDNKEVQPGDDVIVITK